MKLDSGEGHLRQLEKNCYKQCVRGTSMYTEASLKTNGSVVTQSKGIKNGSQRDILYITVNASEQPVCINHKTLYCISEWRQCEAVDFRLPGIRHNYVGLQPRLPSHR